MPFAPFKLHRPRGSTGTLTRTVTTSPSIKQIFYAKVWRKQRDVLCIKATSFDIRVVDDNFLLKVVASRDDLDGVVVSSLVLPEDTLEQIQFNDSMDVMQDLHHELASETYCLSPQIIVLTLQRALERTLVFMFGYSNDAQKVQFGIRGYPLLSLGQNAIGTSMAVDPGSRILAVAAQTGVVSLFKLRSWQEIRQQVERDGNINHENFDPLVENAQLEVKGANFIWHMDFVNSPDNERNSTFLVIMAEKQIGRVLIVFKIDCNRSIKQIKPLYTIKLGLIEHARPDISLSMIPLKHHPGLLICTEKHLALLVDIRNPHFEVQSAYLGDREAEAADDVTCQSRPLHTTWSHSVRQESWLSKIRQDLIYLGREDGQVKALSLSSDGGKKPKIEMTILGSLQHNIDQAFAAIDLPNDAGHHSFVTGGSNCNGVLATILPKKQVRLRYLMSDACPMIDFTVVQKLSNDFTMDGRVFATINRGSKHGAISEIRHGIGLQVLEHIPADAGDVVRIACLPFRKTIYLILTTMTTGTRLHRLDDLLTESSGTAQNMNSLSLASDQKHHEFFAEAVSSNGRHIAAELTQDGYYINISSKAIQRLSTDWTDLFVIMDEEARGGSILDAKIDSYSSQVLYIAATSETLELRLINWKKDLEESLKSTTLDSEPSSICLYTDKELCFAIISTQQGNLEVYSAEGPNLVRRLVYNVHPKDGVCEDLVILRQMQSVSDKRRLSLLCGLRSGTLKLLDLNFKNKDFVITQRDSAVIGLTSVHVMAKHTDIEQLDGQTPTAFVYCDEKCYIFIDAGYGLTGSTLKRLWFVDSRSQTTEQTVPTYPGRGLYQAIVLSMAQIPPSSLLSSLPTAQCAMRRYGTDDIFCLTRFGIRRCYVDIDQLPQNIPWQIPVGGNPVRTIWSSYHKRLIAGVQVDLVVDRSPEARKRDSKKITFGAIKILNPDPIDNDMLISYPPSHDLSYLPVIGAAPNMNAFAAILDPSGERISELAEWQVTARGKRYHMLLVGTLERIRLYNFQAADGPLELKATVPDQAKEAILGIAVFDSTSFVTLTHSSIVLYRLEEQESTSKINFRQITRTTLGLMRGSRSISVWRSQIVVGTQNHGIQAFALQNDTIQHIYSGKSGGCVSETIALRPSRLGNRHHPELEDIEWSYRFHISAVHHQPAHSQAGSDSAVSTLITGSLQGDLVCEQTPPQFRPDFRLILPGRITKIQETCPHPLYDRLKYWPEAIDAEAYAQMLTSSLDGTFHSITILAHPVFKLLKLLTNLIEDERATLCPFRLGSTHERKILLPSEDRTDAKNGYGNVDGDLLMRLLRMDSIQQSSTSSSSSTAATATAEDPDPDSAAVVFLKRLIAQDYIAESASDSDGEPGKAAWLKGMVRDLLVEILGEQRVQDAGGVERALLGFVRSHVDY